VWALCCTKVALQKAFGMQVRKSRCGGTFVHAIAHAKSKVALHAVHQTKTKVTLQSDFHAMYKRQKCSYSGTFCRFKRQLRLTGYY
jgi:hypothetical protein